MMLALGIVLGIGITAAVSVAAGFFISEHGTDDDGSMGP
jgi:uncharacterized protein YneF (UPF0154 family)